ncbi:MAG: hypothetical protein K2K16_13050 [Ruminococcus sp.]|nr:hypothetical protein [Ruminococcus sp.]
MKTLKKKIMAMVAIATTTIGVMSVTYANAVHVAGLGDCAEGCISEWKYDDSDAYSNYYNDEHKHLSYVTVGGNNYYSDGGSSYYVNAGNWAYSSHSKSWYQSASCHYRNSNGCEPPMIATT